MYHSVTRSEEATWIDPANHVPAAVFEEQMKLLVRERRVIALDTLIRTIGAGKDPEPGSVVPSEHSQSTNGSQRAFHNAVIMLVLLVVAAN